MADYIQTGISLTRGQDQAIRALADKLGISYSETVRNLLGIALPFAQDRYALNYGRIVTIIEYTSAALDILVGKLAPEAADELLDGAIRNARTYHAG